MKLGLGTTLQTYTVFKKKKKNNLTPHAIIVVLGLYGDVEDHDTGDQRIAVGHYPADERAVQLSWRYSRDQAVS